MRPTLYYDDSCYLCRQLANYLSKAEPNCQYEKLENLHTSELDSNQEKLVFQFADQLYIGEFAWQKFAEHMQGAESLTWLFKKILLLEPTRKMTIKTLEKWRSLCRRC